MWSTFIVRMLILYDTYIDLTLLLCSGQAVCHSGVLQSLLLPRQYHSDHPVSVPECCVCRQQLLASRMEQRELCQPQQHSTVSNGILSTWEYFSDITLWAFVLPLISLILLFSSCAFVYFTFSLQHISPLPLSFFPPSLSLHLSLLPHTLSPDPFISVSTLFLVFFKPS